MTRTNSQTKWQGQAALALGVSCPVMQRSEKPGHSLSTSAPKVPAYLIANSAADFRPPA